MFRKRKRKRKRKKPKRRTKGSPARRQRKSPTTSSGARAPLSSYLIVLSLLVSASLRRIPHASAMPTRSWKRSRAKTPCWARRQRPRSPLPCMARLKSAKSSQSWRSSPDAAAPWRKSPPSSPLRAQRRQRGTANSSAAQTTSRKYAAVGPVLSRWAIRRRLPRRWAPRYHPLRRIPHRAR